MAIHFILFVEHLHCSRNKLSFNKTNNLKYLKRNSKMQRLPSLFFLGIILWFVVIVSLLWKINYIHFDSSSNHMKSLIRRVNGYDGSDASSSIDDGQGDAKKRQQQQLEEDTKISLDVINGINLVLDPHYLVIKVPRVSAPGVESSSDKRSAANELRDAMGAREEDLDDPNANSISYESSYSFHLSKQITDFKIKVKIKITAVNGMFFTSTFSVIL